jgi:hypothetical protein
MMFRTVFWDVLPCKMIVDHTFPRQYIPEDNSEQNNKVIFIRYKKWSKTPASVYSILSTARSRVRELHVSKVCR